MDEAGGKATETTVDKNDGKLQADKTFIKRKRFSKKQNVNWKNKFRPNIRREMPKFNRNRDARVPIDSKKLEKYKRGSGINPRMVKVDVDKRKQFQKEKKISYALEQSVRSELLLTEEPGYIEDGDDDISKYTQSDIKEAVDLSSASKRFDLHLKDFGPYRINYTRNGRYLLLGGERGHVAAFDWISKKLMCEMNVMESVHDVQWLHQETLYAVAQKKWTYFYDNQGIEIHCAKKLNNIVKLMFLPYHFLLTTVSGFGQISWLDITIGKIVEQLRIPVHRSGATVAEHPGNAFIGIGQPSGIVSFWSPNHNKPYITKWCHKQPLCALAFDPKGQTMVTSSLDRTLKIWDARKLEDPLQEFTLRHPPNWISLSQRGLMALGMGNVVEIYKDGERLIEVGKKLYLRHEVQSPVKNIEFCPYEDILGIGHTIGFSSILVPGSAEPNFDALEANPFQTKSQRRESEIQKLLTKIPPELITWDPTELRKVHIPSLEDIIEEKKKLGFIKPPDVKIEPRYKMGKKSGSANAIKRKKIMKEEHRRNQIKMVKKVKSGETSQEEEQPKKKKKTDVLDRFKPKIKK